MEKILRIFTYFGFSSNRSNNSDKLLPKESPHIKEKNETSKENTSQKNVQESAKDDSQDDSQKGQSSNDKKFQPISQHKEKDVITIEIDDDDDDDEVQVNYKNTLVLKILKMRALIIYGLYFFLFYIDYLI